MLKQHSYVILFLLILCWTLNPFLKKTIAKKIPTKEYIIYNQCLCTFIVFIYALFLFNSNNLNVDFINNLTTRELVISSFGAIVTVMASLLLVQLLKDNDASSVIPQIQPCIILLTLLIGYFLFNESITINKIIGTVLIIFGLIFINN